MNAQSDSELVDQLANLICVTKGHQDGGDECIPDWEESRAFIAKIKAEALEEAAESIDWEWEAFEASDGIMSIRQHGKGPSELLRTRAATYRAGGE